MDKEIKEKHYNNLKDSIAITLLLGLTLLCLIFSLALAYTGHTAENVDSTKVIIISAIFGPMCAILLFLIIIYCYGYYVVDNDKVVFRNLYSKRIILFSDITNIEIKEESAFVLGTYKTDVLTIRDTKTRIKIYINDKNRETILKFVEVLNKYIQK